MSFYYCQVPTEKKKAKVYGFKKVDRKDLDDITERLSKQTYNTRLQRDEPKRLTNFSNVMSRDNSRLTRAPSSCSRRSASASGIGRSRSPRKFTDKELSRMIRRLRKPTISSRVNDVNFDVNEFKFNGELSMDDIPIRPRTAEDRAKSLENLCRPTTASSSKSFERNKYAGENYYKYETEYVYSSSVPPEEINELVDRVSRTTISRSNGSVKCSKSLPRVESEIELTKAMKLPLMSGLPKSRTTGEIVERLYSPSKSLGPSACF